MENRLSTINEVSNENEPNNETNNDSIKTDESVVQTTLNKVLDFVKENKKWILIGLSVVVVGGLVKNNHSRLGL